MKNLILASGLICLILNLGIFLIHDNYNSEPFYASELSLALSICLIYITSISKLDNVFKIALTLGLTLLCVVKFILAIYVNLPLKNNMLFTAIIIITALEFLTIISLRYFTRHA